jgi:hypothetical protein
MDEISRPDWDFVTPPGGGVSTERMPGSSLRPASSIESGTVMSLEEISRLAPAEGEKRLPVNNDGQRPETALDSTGIAHEVLREMRHAADGLEANLERAAENAGKIEQGFAKALGCTVEALNAELAKAPPAMRAKIQREVWRGTRNLDLRLQRVFTLDEQSLYDQAIARLVR